MQLIRFKGKKINGNINCDIKFNEDITFLIGINGSGKTTIIKIIQALLSPNIAVLCHIEFDLVEINIQENVKKYKISAKRLKEGCKLSISSIVGEITIPYFSLPNNEYPFRFAELFIDFYKTQNSILATHNVMKAIRALPTPMFLGLERKMLEEEIARPRYRAQASRTNVFPSILTSSLEEAIEHAAIAYRQLQGKEETLKNKMRNELLLENFKYVDVLPQNNKPLKLPTLMERKKIADQRGSITSLLKNIGLTDTDIDEKVEPFFINVEKLIKELPQHEKGGAKEELTEQQSQSLISWAFNQWQFDKIAKLTDRMAEFTTKSNEIYKKINDFIKILNGFFEESGKSIQIDRFGMTVIDRKGTVVHSPNLSSGEQQLLVLLTHLAFNPAAEKANVLIIDEPEISLHILWQEKFADALLAVNKSAQFILATHSPSIILDRGDKCVEFSEE